MDQIRDIKENGNHITAELSYADLIQLGGIAAVQYCGGPEIAFRMGREDIPEEGFVSYASRLANPHDESVSVAAYERIGLNNQEMVALQGCHTLGGAKPDRSGFDGRWTQNPYVFDNSYYKELLLGERSKFLKTAGESMLTNDPERLQWVEK